MKGKTFFRYLFKEIFQILMKLPFLQNIRIIFYFIDFMILISLSKPVKVRDDIKRAIIVFPLALGDCILFGSSIKKYRELFPEKEYVLSLLIPKGYEELFVPYVDEIISFDFKISSVNLLYRRKIYKKLREQKYDILIDPYPCNDCTPNIYMSRAICSEEKIGFMEESSKKKQCTDMIRKRIYSRLHYISKEGGLHRVTYYRKVLQCLGVEAGAPECMTIPRTKLNVRLPDKYFVVFPSAGIDTKKWEIDKFYCLVDKIINCYKLPLVLCGTESDRKDVRALKDKLCSMEIIDLVGEHNILEFCEIIGGADFLVTNDTSAYHIGVAKDIKTFLISGGYCFDKFSKYPMLPDNLNQPIVICAWRDCFNCDNHCKYIVRERYLCIKDITVESVWNCIKDNLKENECCG